MLERQWAAAAARPDWRGSGASAEFINLSDILAFFSRYVVSILLWALVGIVGASLYLATSDRIFTARTQILIEPKLPQFMQQQMVEVSLSLDTAQIESQLALLRSQKIAMMVVEELGLAHDEAFRDTGGPGLGERFARLEALISGKPYVPASVEEADADQTEAARKQRAADIFSRSLDVQRVGVSYAIDIYFKSQDPALAARIANATADAFVREQMETRAVAAREGVVWLEKRIDEAGAQMNKATQIAQEFRATYDYRIDKPDDASAADGRHADAPTLEQLEVQAETYRKMYESLLSAYAGAVNQQPFLIANSRVITTAVQPNVQSQPRKRLTLIFGAFAGLMLGVGLAFVRHSLDRTLRTPRQIGEQLGLVCIGELPPAVSRKGPGVYDEVVRDPHSPFSANLRSARAVISLADAGKSRLCIGITSAPAGGNKSAVASNLAALYAASGVPTLLVDMNPRFTLTHAFGGRFARADTDDGLHEHGSAACEIGTVAPALFDFLPNAERGPATLALPANMQALLKKLDGYKVVIFDLPAYEFGADGLLVCSLLDGVVVVAEGDRTPLDSLADLARTLRIANAPLLGVLLMHARRLPRLPLRRLLRRSA